MPSYSRKRIQKKHKTRKHRGGLGAFTTHVKTLVRNSKVRPGKPFYKVFVFDEINGTFFEALQKFMINTVDDTEEDLISMREAWNKKDNKANKQPKDVVVYGYKITPK